MIPKFQTVVDKGSVLRITGRWLIYLHQSERWASRGVQVTTCEEGFKKDYPAQYDAYAKNQELIQWVLSEFIIERNLTRVL